jgi:hypothetical protein
MNCQSKVDHDFRVKGASYLPERGEIVLRVRATDGLALCIVVTEHDGSAESLREMNSAMRSWASRAFSSMSSTKSNTYYRTEDEDAGVVSHDGDHIAPLDSRQGRRILSAASTAEKQCDG